MICLQSSGRVDLELFAWLGIYIVKKYIYVFGHLKNGNNRSSGQDRGIGRNPSLPHATERRIPTNLKTINNKKCQKIKLHGTLTTKELKNHSPDQ